MLAPSDGQPQCRIAAPRPHSVLLREPGPPLQTLGGPVLSPSPSSSGGRDEGGGKKSTRSAEPSHPLLQAELCRLRPHGFRFLFESRVVIYRDTPHFHGGLHPPLALLNDMERFMGKVLLLSRSKVDLGPLGVGEGIELRRPVRIGVDGHVREIHPRKRLDPGSQRLREGSRWTPSGGPVPTPFQRTGLASFGMESPLEGLFLLKAHSLKGLLLLHAHPLEHSPHGPLDPPALRHETGTSVDHRFDSPRGGQDRFPFLIPVGLDGDMVRTGSRLEGFPLCPDAFSGLHGPPRERSCREVPPFAESGSWTLPRLSGCHLPFLIARQFDSPCPLKGGVYIREKYGFHRKNAGLPIPGHDRNLIDSTLHLISSRLNEHLRLRGELAEDAVALSNLVELDGAVAPHIENRLVLFIVNLAREESFSPQHRRMGSSSGEGQPTGYPELQLNLHLMVAAHFPGNYREALKFISAAISFFQGNPVFTRAGSPGLDPSLDKVVLEIQNLNVQDLSNLWGILGGKYLPSILYRVRMIPVDSRAITRITPPIREPITREPIIEDVGP